MEQASAVDREQDAVVLKEDAKIRASLHEAINNLRDISGVSTSATTIDVVDKNVLRRSVSAAESVTSGRESKQAFKSLRRKVGSKRLSTHLDKHVSNHDCCTF